MISNKPPDATTTKKAGAEKTLSHRSLGLKRTT